MPVKLSSERLRAGLVIALLVGTLVALARGTGLLERIEWASYDYRLHLWRAEQPLHPDIAVVLIDEHSLSVMDPMLGRFPWPRSVYADLIEFFRRGGARAVVFDILFSEQQRNGNSLREDRALAEAGARAGNVFHAAEFRWEPPDENAKSVAASPLPATVRSRFVLDSADGFPDPGLNAYTLPVPALLATSRGIGGVSLDADSDGVFRRAQLFFNYRGDVIPAHGVAPVLDRLPEPVRYEPGAIHFGASAIPLDRTNRYLVNMAGEVRPYSIAGIFSTILQLEQGQLDHLLIDPYEFENKVVFIGSNAVGLQDLKTTALSTKTPGVYIHASIMSNLLAGDFLRQPPLTLELALTAILLMSAVFLLLSNHRILVQATVPLLLALGYAVFAVLAFDHGWVFEMATPLAGIAVGMTVTFGFLAVTEGRDKRRVRAMFSRYVSPAVLEQVVDRFEEQAQAQVGTRQHLSILFSDVRGFTSLSEQMSAEKVVDLLNVHFSVMGEIIFRHHGTLDKFIGDAIMAFWGAPIPVTDHARQSVLTAIEMSRQMSVVNAELAARGHPRIDVGIGINTGDVVLGNVGFERKLEYTAIGDHVNLASRLEGLTKQYGCRVILSEFTHRELGDEFPCAVIDLVRVKGKAVPIRIYSPLAMPGDPAPELESARGLAALSEHAFARYLDRDFSAAEALYSRFPDGPLRELMRERCRLYLEQPPAPEWDGVCVLTVK